MTSEPMLEYFYYIEMDNEMTSHWREAVGGMCEEIGLLQFNFLVTNGLLPSNKLLDVGCGSLRGGIHFIRYLEKGHYFGIDKEQWLLDAGVNNELKKEGLVDRKPTLICRDDFNFSVFQTSFDYAIAQSVFTHLPWNSILRCLYNMKPVLNPKGRFFATYFEAPDGPEWNLPVQHSPGSIVTFPDKDPYHYNFSIFKELANRVDFYVENIGEWDHPRAQKILLFTHLNS